MTKTQKEINLFSQGSDSCEISDKGSVEDLPEEQVFRIARNENVPLPKSSGESDIGYASDNMPNAEPVLKRGDGRW
jgi:hypothetical protein